MKDRFRGNSVPIVRGYDLRSIKDPNHQAQPFRYQRHRLFSLGGVELWTLYTCYMNFDLAAEELNMTEGALRQWFNRWRKTLKVNVLDRLSFDVYCRG